VWQKFRYSVFGEVAITVQSLVGCIPYLCIIRSVLAIAVCAVCPLVLEILFWMDLVANQFDSDTTRWTTNLS